MTIRLLRANKGMLAIITGQRNSSSEMHLCADTNVVDIFGISTRNKAHVRVPLGYSADSMEVLTCKLSQQPHWSMVAAKKMSVILALEIQPDINL